MRVALLVLAVLCGVLSGVEAAAPAKLRVGSAAVAVWAICLTATGTAAVRVAHLLFWSDAPALRLIATVALFQAAAAGVVTWTGWLGVYIPPVQLLAVGIVAAIAALPRTVTAVSAVPVRPDPTDCPGPLGWAGLGVGGLACLQVGFDLVRSLPIDSDNMWYHFPMVAEWIRSGSIRPSEAIPSIARAYPGFREAVMSFLTLPVGTEHLAIPGMWELPAFGLACGLLARELGVPSPAAWAAAGYAVTAHQVTVAGNGNDLGLALGLITSILFLTRYTDRENPADAALAGVCLGTTASMKFSGLIYSGLLMGLFGLRHLLIRLEVSRSTRLRTTLEGWGMASAAVLLIAGPWYARNVLAFGNPIYPAEVTVMGAIVFPGPLGRDFFAPSTLKWDIWPLVGNAHFFTDAFGRLIPVIGFGAGVVALLGIVRPRFLIDWRPLMVLPIALFVAFLHQPYNRPSFGFDYNMRYLIGWFGVCIVVTLLPLRTAPSVIVVGAAGTLVLATVVNTADWSAWWKVYAVTAVVSSIAGSLIVPRLTDRIWGALGPPGVRVAAASLLIFAAGIYIGTVRDRNQYSAEYGYRDNPSSRGWGAISQFVHQKVSRERVAVAGDNRFFPFYGDRFENSAFPLLSSETSAGKVYEAARASGATVLVCLNRIAARPGLTDYQFEESVGAELVHMHPEAFEILFEIQGGYVLRLNTKSVSQ